MKANIHPTWYPNAQVTCACGNNFTVGSTVDKIHVELCAKCHPFFTGTQKLVDTQGQVERFTARQTNAKAKAEQRAQIIAARQTRQSQEVKDKPSLKDLLMQARKRA